MLLAVLGGVVPWVHYARSHTDGDGGGTRLEKTKKTGRLLTKRLHRTRTSLHTEERKRNGCNIPQNEIQIQGAIEMDKMQGQDRTGSGAEKERKKWKKTWKEEKNEIMECSTMDDHTSSRKQRDAVCDPLFPKRAAFVYAYKRMYK